MSAHPHIPRACLACVALACVTAGLLTACSQDTPAAGPAHDLGRRPTPDMDRVPDDQAPADQAPGLAPDPLPQAVFDGQVELGPESPLGAGTFQATLSLHGAGAARQGVLVARSGQGQIGFAFQGQAQARGLDLALGASRCAPDCLMAAPGGQLQGQLSQDQLSLRGEGLVRRLSAAVRSDLYREPHDGFRPSTVGPPWPPLLATRPEPVTLLGDWSGYVFALPGVLPMEDPLRGAGCALALDGPADSPTLRAMRCHAGTDHEAWEGWTDYTPGPARVDLTRRQATLEAEQGPWRWRLTGSLDSQIIDRPPHQHRLYRCFGRVERAPSAQAQTPEAWELVGTFAMSSWGPPQDDASR